MCVKEPGGRPAVDQAGAWRETACSLPEQPRNWLQSPFVGRQCSSLHKKSPAGKSGAEVDLDGDRMIRNASPSDLSFVAGLAVEGKRVNLQESRYAECPRISSAAEAIRESLQAPQVPR